MKGQLPEGWKKVKLGDVLQKTNNIDPRKTPDDDFVYIDVSSVSRTTFSIEKTVCLKGKDAPSRARKKVETGDVLFATIRPTLQRIAIVLEAYNGEVCSTGYFVLRPKEEIENHFLYYYLFTETFMSEMEKRQKGASYPAVNNGDIKDQTLSFPPLPEQKRIVAILDKAFEGINQAIANAEKNLANAREIFESYLNDVFTRKGEGWEEVLFGDTCDFVRGPFGGSLKKSCFVEDGYAVYEQQHAINDQFNQIRYFVDQEKFDEMKRFEIRSGDLIMSCSGTMGKIAIAPQNVKQGIINQALLKLTPKKNLSSGFLKYWMESNSFQEQIASHSKGVAIKNVASVKVLKKINVPVPQPDVQHNVVIMLNNYLHKTQHLQSIYQKKLNALQELKQSILQKAFSGNLDTNIIR